MPIVKAYGAAQVKAPLGPLEISRREPGPTDVVIDIAYCGICHSDLHQARDEWGGAIFPMVPGHEIVGTVSRVGSAVTTFKARDRAGAGCMVDSCRTCASCQDSEEQFCESGGPTFTYNAYERDGKTPTYGGYSTQVVVDQSFVLSIPAGLPLDASAPLLCAGITTYSPLKHWEVAKGDQVGVVGLGGLGHMAVKLAAAMGAEVTVFSTSDRKKADAMRLGATSFINTTADQAFAGRQNHFDFIINTVSANIDLNAYLTLLRRDATMVLVGAPEHPSPIAAFPLIMGRRSLAGSPIGGIKQTQEMLDFCAQQNIVSDIEVIPVEAINDAYERMVKGDVRYRFVIDLGSLK